MRWKSSAISSSARFHWRDRPPCFAELPLATGSRTNVQAVADFVERSVGIVGLSLTDRDGATVDNRGNVGATALRMLDGKPLSVQVERDPIWSVWCTRSYSSRCRHLAAHPSTPGRVRGNALAMWRSASRVKTSGAALRGCGGRGCHPAGCGAALAGIDKSRDQGRRRTIGRVVYGDGTSGAG